jgi:hypothetical protein
MTNAQKILITKLLKGFFLRKSKSRKGTCYVLYDAKINPIEKINARTVERIDRFIDPEIKIWKTSFKGNITLNLSMVRRLHGKSTIKKLYKMKDELDNNLRIYKTRNNKKKLKHINDEKVNYLF